MMSRKRTKGSVVLGILKEGALTTAEIFTNALLAPFRISYRGVPALLHNKEISLRNVLTTLKENRKERRRFYGLLVNLKRDGLIVATHDAKEVGWSLSQKGIRELAKLQQQPEIRYPKHTSQSVIVISYDIPEKYRVTRGWLRSILKLLDFKMLHQSVWIGKTEIPESLLTDLRERKISTFVHIFTVGKEGSLTQML